MTSKNELAASKETLVIGAAGVEDASPLVLDLDGTLLRTDTLYEGLALFLRRNPLNLVRALGWLARFGRAGLKRRLAAAVELEVERLPVNEELVAYALEAKAAGRRIFIATAGDERVAHVAVRCFPFAEGIIASDGRTNLKGAAKARTLAELFPQGFTYAGDAKADLAVWRQATGTIVVGASPRVERLAAALREPEAVFARAPRGLGLYVKALRLHQWAKNALIFAPLVLGGLMTDLAAWGQAGLGFVALGLVASATYLLNDLIDLADDRRHWSKRHRPLASGRMPIVQGLALAPVMLLAGLLLAASLGGAAFGVVCLYLALTLAYSWRLKREPILDAAVLSVLFTLRLALGIAAVGVAVSTWLLVFSLFLFLSLSLAKRHTELERTILAGGSSARGYVAKDAPLLLGLGLASATSAVLILVLYVLHDGHAAGFYTWRAGLWSFPPVLFLWLGRVWLLSGRGELDDDPVAFAVRDRVSLCLGGVLGLGFLAAAYGGVVGL